MPQRLHAPYWMEAPLWQAAGIPALVCGPAGGGLHAADEWVDLDQVRRYAVALTAAVAAGRPSMPTDPRRLRGDAPLLDAWLRFHEEAPTPFTIPGHKQRHDLVGDVVAGDVPLYAGLDTMKLARGVVAEAEARAARLWGADLCRFSVGGSTHGNQALALAVGAARRPGRRRPHPAPLDAARASCSPGWSRCGCAPRSTRPTGCRSASPPPPSRPRSPTAPDARAVFVGDPSYVGTVGDVGGAGHGGAPARHPARRRRRLGRPPRLPPRAAAARARRRGRRPGDQRAQGAAGLVAGGARARPQPAHRPRPVRRRASRPPPRRARRAPSSPASTPPAPCSSATARRCSARSSRPWRPCAQRLARVPGLVVLDGPGVDPMRLTLVLPGTGADGNAVEADLLARGMPVEMADRDTVVAMVTLADTPEGLVDLAVALAESVERHRGQPAAGGHLRGVGGRPGHRHQPARGVLRAARERGRRAGRRTGSAPSSSRPTRPASRCWRPARRSPSTPSRPCAPRGRPAAGSPTPPTRPVHTLDVIAE